MTQGRKAAAVGAIALKSVVFKCIKVASGQLRRAVVMSQCLDSWCKARLWPERDGVNIN